MKRKDLKSKTVQGVAAENPGRSSIQEVSGTAREVELQKIRKGETSMKQQPTRQEHYIHCAGSGRNYVKLEDIGAATGDRELPRKMLGCNLVQSIRTPDGFEILVPRVSLRGRRFGKILWLANRSQFENTEKDELQAQP